MLKGPGGRIPLDGITISLKGPLIPQSSGKGNAFSINGAPEAGQPAEASWLWRFTR